MGGDPASRSRLGWDNATEAQIRKARPARPNRLFRREQQQEMEARQVSQRTIPNAAVSKPLAAHN